MKVWLARAWKYLKFLKNEYGRDRCGQAAAALAFGTLLSIVPLAALLTWLLRPYDWSLDGVLEFLSRYFLPTPEFQSIITEAIERYAGNAGAMGLFGLAFFLFVAWGMLMSVEGVFNDIWHVENRRGQVHKLGTFWAAVIFAPLLFIASATLNQNLSRSAILGPLVENGHFEWLFADLVPFLLLVTSLGLGYLLLPHTTVRKRAAGIGALVAAVLYQVARWIFVWYLDRIATFDTIYGILGVIPAFLMWLFFVWSVVLIGAEVSYTVDRPWEELERG